MLHDLQPLQKRAQRDAVIVAHMANRGVFSILALFEMLVPNTNSRVLQHFSSVSGLSSDLGVVYLLDLVHELGSIDHLCRRTGDANEGLLPRGYVMLLKRYLAAECPELTAFDATDELLSQTDNA